MAQLPTTYEEFLALPSEDRARLHEFCTRHNVQQIASATYSEEEWDWSEPDPNDDWSEDEEASKQVE